MAFDLDRSQQSAWESYLAGKNVGLFGRAGCGKSAVLKRAIAHARRAHGADRVGVMAWTTAAARMIDGHTMHKFLRVGIAELPKDLVLESVKKNRLVRRKVADTAVIFIDELPLVPKRWLTTLEYVVRQLGPIGEHGRPWGRCQVVVAGDPLQLGPVQSRLNNTDEAVYACREFRQFFLSRYGLVFFLTGSHRQANDSWFVGCLDRGRKGEVSDADLMVLIATSDGVAAEAWNERTQLRALNVEVDAFNRGKLSRLPGAEVVYSCRDEVAVGITHPARRAYAQRCMLEICTPPVSLKPGAVVLTTREVSGVATGTQGVVQSCLSSSVVCDFAGRRVVVSVMAFDVIDNCGTTLATRHAIPLVLAWAMTIHRAQGGSLNTLAIDFSELDWRLAGLVYSGLSRCRSLDGLLVRGLRRDQIVVDAGALRFHTE